MMRINRVKFAAASMAIASAATLLAFAQPEPRKGQHGGDGEVEIRLAEAPEAVRAAIARLTPADKVTKVVRETDGGITVYEVEYASDGGEASADLSAAGDVLCLEHAVKEGAVPVAAMAAVRKHMPGATVKGAVLVQKFSYEVRVEIGGEVKEVKVDASGEMDDDGHDADHGREDGKRRGHHEKDDDKD